MKLVVLTLFSLSFLISACEEQEEKAGGVDSALIGTYVQRGDMLELEGMVSGKLATLNKNFIALRSLRILKNSQLEMSTGVSRKNGLDLVLVGRVGLKGTVSFLGGEDYWDTINGQPVKLRSLRFKVAAAGAVRLLGEAYSKSGQLVDADFEVEIYRRISLKDLLDSSDKAQTHLKKF